MLGSSPGNKQPIFSQATSSLISLVVVVSLSVLLMYLDRRHAYLDTLRTGMTTLVYPIQRAADLPVRGGRWLVRSLVNQQTLLDENLTLRQQRLEDQHKLQSLAELQAENERLRALLESAARVPEQVIVADLLSVDLDPFSHLILLDKGTRGGVRVGQPLLDAEGVMGQIVETGPFSAYAMLITDPNHALPVRVHRNGLRGIAFGTGFTDQLELPDLPVNADIREGDLLVTSGLGGRYPEGLPAAIVTEVVRDPTDDFARITARPTAMLDRSREVLLVVSRSRVTTEAEPDGTTTATDIVSDEATAKDAPTEEMPAAETITSQDDSSPDQSPDNPDNEQTDDTPEDGDTR